MIIDRYVVSKSYGVRIPCDGPATALNERTKLEVSLNAAGKRWDDVEIEFVEKPLPRARASEGHKRSTKLRYK
jgi:hypothetical protein